MKNIWDYLVFFYEASVRNYFSLIDNLIPIRTNSYNYYTRSINKDFILIENYTIRYKRPWRFYVFGNNIKPKDIKVYIV